MSKLFEDRKDAGIQLACELMKKRRENVVVIALPRGGVGVAMEVARAYKVALELLFVRKLGAPFNPELGIGAIVEGQPPQTFLHKDLIKVLKVTDDYLEEEKQKQLEVIKTQQQKFRAGREKASVTGKSVIVIDDGIATGATVQAALKGLKSEKPAHLTIATPVSPPETIDQLRPEVDEVVCLTMPHEFQAVGQFYRNFPQLEDDVVKHLLAESKNF